MTIQAVADAIIDDWKFFDLDVVDLIQSKVNVCDLPLLVMALKPHRSGEASSVNVAIDYIDSVL